MMPYLFTGILALPLCIILLVTPIQHLYEKYLRYKYYSIVKKYCENPYGVDEEKLSEIFPDKKRETLEQIAFYLEEEFTYKVN